MVNELIHKYCGGNEPLEQILLIHSCDVARRALRIAKSHPELNADETLLWEAAMLHDIGIVRVDAPSIFCYGTEPYICHGILGAEILRAEGLPLHARVAERHTGTGLTAAEIERQNLPLPHQDFTPQSIEEQIICYADKFYSKTRLSMEKTPEQALRSLEKFGSDGLDVFRAWMARFE
ncbi:MAG: HD domain-containing protein [Bacteroidaceae bacterium]|nr:HD domain-containing protein [Bacteroidaceae bacterium]